MCRVRRNECDWIDKFDWIFIDFWRVVSMINWLQNRLEMVNFIEIIDFLLKN